MDKVTEEDKIIFDLLTEIFGTSEELHNCIQEANDVIKTFLVANQILGTMIPQSSEIRLQKVILLFDLLLSVGVSDNVGQSESN